MPPQLTRHPLTPLLSTPQAVGAPIFHVNADDAEAVAHVCTLAVDWRQVSGEEQGMPMATGKMLVATGRMLVDTSVAKLL